jgi:hypothetical protein
MFAALNTVEPPVLELGNAGLLEGDQTWYDDRLPLVEDRLRDRPDQLSGRPGDADWLDGAFSAGDRMMVSVLLRYKRAFDAQLAVYTGESSAQRLQDAPPSTQNEAQKGWFRATGPDASAKLLPISKRGS